MVLTRSAKGAAPAIKAPEAIVALGLPEFPRYRTLSEETQVCLAKLGVALLTVGANGGISSWGLDEREIVEVLNRTPACGVTHACSFLTQPESRTLSGSFQRRTPSSAKM